MERSCFHLDVQTARRPGPSTGAGDAPSSRPGHAQLPSAPLSHPYLELVFQFIRTLLKNLGTPVQDLSYLLGCEKALVPKDADKTLQVLLAHGEDLWAAAKDPLQLP